MDGHNIVYGVRLRQGPDIAYYDLYFDENAIRLKYLGEYWETIKPLYGLQQSMDLLLYNVNKVKNRQRTSVEKNDMLIEYCSIREYKFQRRTRRFESKHFIRERAKVRGDATVPTLVIVLHDGKRFEIEFSPKVYRLVKKLVKEYMREKLRFCRGTHNMK